MSDTNVNTAMEAEGYTTKVPDNEHGLLEIVAPAKANIDICFVHGLTGNRKSTWTHKGTTKTFWPEKLLPGDLPNARIYSFGYNASVKGVLESGNTLRDHGNDLATELSNTRERDGTNNRPILFVVHSLGGLVIEQALFLCTTSNEPHLASLVNNTYAIAFLGTPHGGADKERMGQVLRRLAKLLGYDTNKKLLETLNPSSEILAGVEQEFQKYLERRKAAHTSPIKIHNYHEELPVDLRVFGIKVGEAGVIVPKESAILDAYPYTKIIASHTEMTKFQTRDKAYKSVVDRLWIWARDCISERAQSQPLKDNDEARERRGNRLEGGNMHTLPSVSAGPVTAGGSVRQTVQAAGGNIDNSSR